MVDRVAEEASVADLVVFSTTNTKPWLVIGDFNVVSCQEEKLGESH